MGSPGGPAGLFRRPAARTRAVLLLAAALLSSPGGLVQAAGAALPPADGLAAPPPPELTAEAWILYDDAYRRVLAEHRADQQRAVASTTKIMTALVVLDEADPGDPVEISENATLIGESEVDLTPGEAGWTVEDLLAALLVRSANDAAVALAEHTAGSVEGFAFLMNSKAVEMGLRNTNFVNPHGLDHPDHYSSARDLLFMALSGMEDERFARLVGTRSAVLPAAPGGRPRVVLNSNKLLEDYPGAVGVKTGYTDDAALTLVAAAERGGRRLYAVVLGSTGHFADAAALLDYGFEEFSPVTLTPFGGGERRPLAVGLLDPGPEEPADGFELFLAEPPGEEAAAPAETVPAPEREEPPAPAPEYTEPAEQAPPPEPAVVRELERRPDLPGMADALGWAGRYWNWIFG